MKGSVGKQQHPRRAQMPYVRQQAPPEIARAQEGPAGVMRPRRQTGVTEAWCITGANRVPLAVRQRRPRSGAEEAEEGLYDLPIPGLET
ncbi:hypothetical protein NDU88_000780 [Pleurodeles waltl]|uniref:Uncharacterized protein n=1 Tax=Pleurodeles waltl TaxID=8319 RepID=A0AAV7LFP8_PLEWA|nr:hypothetical protein NDU88_000780 [Pleurodeles waltl]